MSYAEYSRHEEAWEAAALLRGGAATATKPSLQQVMIICTRMPHKEESPAAGVLKAAFPIAELRVVSGWLKTSNQLKPHRKALMRPTWRKLSVVRKPAHTSEPG